MTAFEIISIFIGILSLLIANGYCVSILSRQEIRKEEIKMPILSSSQDRRRP